MDASSAVRIRRTNSRNKEDRISALPDALIQHILCFLPSTREAVRTAILSKRWRRQWTQVPVLIFKPGLYCYEGDAFLSFIENTLALHACPRITKFVLEYYIFSDLIDPQFTSKICFAITKSVEELILICPCVMGSYLLPKSVIESASLVRLEMDNCYFESNLVVNLPSLKSLKMDTSLFGDSGRNKVIENVVAGCPLLEQLELRGYKDEDHFAIVSNTLKILSFAHAELPDAVRITCPNLEEFGMTFSTIPRQMIENVLSGCPRVHSLKLGNCSGLEQLQLVIASNSLKVLHLECVDDADIRVSCPNLVKLIMFCWVDTLREVENLPSTVCATLDYIRPNGYDDYFENKLLELFQHVSLLTIEKSLFEIISDLDEEDRAPLPLLKCKCLTLIMGASFGLALPGIVYALSSPMLETLVIEYYAGFRKCLSQEAYQDLRSARLDYWNSKRSTSFPCLVSQLKTVKIVGLYEVDDNCEIVLEFIEYMLKNARVLEKMVVSLEESRKSLVIKVSQKMLSFPRYSQCANVELLCST